MVFLHFERLTRFYILNTSDVNKNENQGKRLRYSFSHDDSNVSTCDQNFIIVLFDDKTIISTIIRGDFPLSNNFVNLFPLSHSHAVCRNTQTLKIRHYCFVHIINVKCFTENITKVRIVGSYRFFREKTFKIQITSYFIYRNRNLNCGIRNSDSQIFY